MRSCPAHSAGLAQGRADDADVASPAVCGRGLRAAPPKLDASLFFSCSRRTTCTTSVMRSMTRWRSAILVRKQSPPRFMQSVPAALVKTLLHGVMEINDWP